MFSLTKLFITFIVFLSLDSFYLFLMKNSFLKLVKTVQGSPLVMSIPGAIICYLSLVLGVFYFIIQDKKSVLDAFLLGIFVYIVYETTNLSIFKDWSWSIATIDTLWGGILFALTTTIVYRIYKI